MKNKRIFGIKIDIILFGLVSLLNDLSSEMIMPILPMFIKSLGGTGIIIGLIGGLHDSIASILKVVSGYFSDKIGKRKIFVFSGYFTSSIFKLLLSLAKSWQHLLICSSLERVGKGMRDAPRDAMISSITIRRGRNFGVHKAFDTSGAILGSTIVFLLFWIAKLDFKSIITIAALVAFLSLIPLHFVKEKEQNEKPKISLKIGYKNLSKRLKRFLVISGTYSLANMSYMFFIIKTQEAFSDKLSIVIPLFLYILYNIFYATLAIPFGILSDKIGRKRVIVSGYLLFSFVSLGFAFAKTLPAFVLLFILYGVVYALVEGNQRAYISDISPEATRATALGIFYTTTGLLALVSSLIAGFLWQKISLSYAFYYSSSVSIFAVILFFVFKRHFRK